MGQKGKNRERVGILFVTVAFAVMLLLAGHAMAANWPEKGKVITMYVPSGAGGGGDIAARNVAQFLEKELGVKFVIVNKAGGGTQVGVTEFLGKSGTDGYMILALNTPAAHAPYLDPDRKSVYSMKDLHLVANYAQGVPAVAAKKGGRFKNLKDLIEAAKASPGKVKVTASNPLTPSDLAMILLEKAAGIQLAHMFYDQQGEQRAALLGDHVDAEMNGCMDFVAGQKAGQIETLAVFDSRESAYLPGIKTAEAQGYKVYMYTGFGLQYKAGTPREIVDAMSAAVQRAAARPEFKETFNKLGLDTRVLVRQAYADYWKYTEDVVTAVLAEAKKMKK